MQGPASFVVLEAQQIIISSNGVAGNGLFVYNPAPGSGTLVDAIVAVAGNDPFGNFVQQGISSQNNSFGTVAQLNAATLTFFAGVVKQLALSPSGYQQFNSHGALIFSVDVSRDAWFLYADTGTSTQGALIASCASGTGTDSFANTFYPGLVNYQASLLGIVQIFAGALNIGKAAQLAGTGGASPAILQLDQAATSVPGSLLMSSGQASSSDPQAIAELLSKAANAAIQPVFTVNNVPLRLGTVTSPLQDATAIVFCDINGIARIMIPVSGDTNQYFAAWSRTAASATPQTISSTSATLITGCSFNVGAGLYLFRARVTFSGGTAAGTANFSVSTSGGIANSWINAAFNMSSGTAGAGAQNAALGPVNSPTLTTGNNVAEIEGELSLTSSGVLNLNCAEGVSGDTVIIQHAHFWLYPIT